MTLAANHTLDVQLAYQAFDGWLCHLLWEAFIAVFGSHTSLLEKINIVEN